MKIMIECNSKSVILLSMLIIFDNIGSHFYSKIVQLGLIIVLMNNLELSKIDTTYENIPNIDTITDIEL